jgi:hypothetical protein
MSPDTAFSPFAPMVLMVSRRAQGVAGEVSGLLGQIVKGSLQVVEFLPLAALCLNVGVSLVALHPFQGADKESALAPRHVFGRHSAVPSDRSV